MSDAINDAIAAAQAAAASAVPAGATVPATQTQAALPATPQARGVPVTMDDLMVGSMQVDEWLKVKEFGLLIGTDATLITGTINVTIDFAAVQPNYSIKYGNPAQYAKTYDRVTSAKGGTWAQAVQMAQMADPKAREYRSADLPMTLTADVVVNGKTVCEAGKKLATRCRPPTGATTSSSTAIAPRQGW